MKTSTLILLVGLLFIALAIAIFRAISHSDGKGLVIVMQDERVRSQLLHFVDQATRQLTKSDLVFDSPDVAWGECRVNKPFDWRLLGLHADANEWRALLDKKGNVEAFYFGNTRYGILVLVDGQSSILDRSRNFVEYRVGRIGVIDDSKAVDGRRQ
jgi:hypothetical protein